MKRFQNPEKRQLLADLLAGNTLAKRQLSELKKPIVWLGGICTTCGPEPVMTDEVATSITYRDGTIKGTHPLPYAEFMKLYDKAENPLLIVIIEPSRVKTDHENN